MSDSSQDIRNVPPPIAVPYYQEDLLKRLEGNGASSPREIFQSDVPHVPVIARQSTNVGPTREQSAMQQQQRAIYQGGMQQQPQFGTHQGSMQQHNLQQQGSMQQHNLQQQGSMQQHNLQQQGSMQQHNLQQQVIDSFSVRGIPLQPGSALPRASHGFGMNTHRPGAVDAHPFRDDTSSVGGVLISPLPNAGVGMGPRVHDTAMHLNNAGQQQGENPGSLGIGLRDRLQRSSSALRPNVPAFTPHANSSIPAFARQGDRPLVFGSTEPGFGRVNDLNTRFGDMNFQDNFHGQHHDPSRYTLPRYDPLSDVRMPTPMQVFHEEQRDNGFGHHTQHAPIPHGAVQGRYQVHPGNYVGQGPATYQQPPAMNAYPPHQHQNGGFNGAFNPGFNGGFNPGFNGGFNPAFSGGFNPAFGGGFNPAFGGGFNPAFGGGFNQNRGGPFSVYPDAYVATYARGPIKQQQVHIPRFRPMESAPNFHNRTRQVPAPSQQMNRGQYSQYPGGFPMRNTLAPLAPYINRPYERGPMEEFSSMPGATAEEVMNTLRMTTSPSDLARPGFAPMERIANPTGARALALGTKGKGKAGGHRVDPSVNCCIYLEGLHPGTNFADLFEAMRGKILRTHITPPNEEYPTAAAKVGFFTRKDALKTFNSVLLGEVYIKGRLVTQVRWNWDGHTEQDVIYGNHFSRVLIIEGPAEIMNMEAFHEAWRAKLHYDMEACFEVPCNNEGRRRYEFRFGSLSNQAEPASWIIRDDPPFKGHDYYITYGRDPCEES